MWPARRALCTCNQSVRQPKSIGRVPPLCFFYSSHMYVKIYLLYSHFVFFFFLPSIYCTVLLVSQSACWKTRRMHFGSRSCGERAWTMNDDDEKRAQQPQHGANLIIIEVIRNSRHATLCRGPLIGNKRSIPVKAAVCISADESRALCTSRMVQNNRRVNADDVENPYAYGEMSLMNYIRQLVCLSNQAPSGI